MGQGQVDTWHHPRGLLEASLTRNLEKIIVSHEPQQFRTMVGSGESISIIFIFLELFARLCENFAWSYEITFHNSLMCCSQHPFCFISHDYAKIPHGHAKLKNMPFQLLFAIFPISSFLIHLHHLQFSFKAWSKCISSFSSFSLCTLLHFIFHLSLHA